MSPKKPTIMLIALRPDWLAACRLPAALHEAGFRVVAICSRQAYMAQTQYIQEFNWIESKFRTYPRSTCIAVFQMIKEHPPEMIIPMDEDAYTLLCDLQTLNRLSFSKALQETLRNSLPEHPAKRSFIDKNFFQDQVQSWQLPHPERLHVPLRSQDFPIVAKANFGSGGQQVRICKNQTELDEFHQSQKLSAFEALRNQLKTCLFYDIFANRPTISWQACIPGPAAFHAFVALNGRYLGGFSAIKLRTHPGRTGPSSVIEGIDLPDLTNLASLLVKKLGYSGFGSFDFILQESSKQVKLLELNPRPVPASHLRQSSGIDLAGLLFESLILRREPPIPTAKPFRVALFPNEILRDPESPFLQDAWHDIPQDDPQLLKFLCRLYHLNPEDFHRDPE